MEGLVIKGSDISMEMGSAKITKREYFSLVHRARELINSGGQKDLEDAERILNIDEEWRPMRLEYICARVDLMLLQGKDKYTCRKILNSCTTEKYVQPVLADVFSVKQKTFPVNSMEWKMCDYTIQLYKGGMNVPVI